jgi:hypothetical protein
LIIKTLRLYRVGARRITVLAAVDTGLASGKARNELNFARRSGHAGRELESNVRRGNQSQRHHGQVI